MRSRKESGKSGALMGRLSPVVTWSLSIILALLFAAVGFSKLWGPSAARWGVGYPLESQYVIGALEIVSGLALLLPRSRKPAAGSLTLVMAGAICTHVMHGEWLRVMPPLLLGILSRFCFSFPRLQQSAHTQALEIRRMRPASSRNPSESRGRIRPITGHSKIDPTTGRRSLTE